MAETKMNPKKKRQEGEENEAIDLTGMEIGKRSPMAELLLTASRSTNYYLFGKLYYEGLEVKGVYLQDYTLSARYLTAALKEGVVEAAFYLGELYYYGQGVMRNYAEAYNFY